MIVALLIPSFMPTLIRYFTIAYVFWCIFSPLFFTVLMVGSIFYIQKKCRKEALEVFKILKDSLTGILNEENNTKYYAHGVQLLLKVRDFPGAFDEDSYYIDNASGRKMNANQLIPQPSFEIQVILSQTMPVLVNVAPVEVAQPAVQVNVVPTPNQENFYAQPTKFEAKPMQQTSLRSSKK